MVGGGSKVYLDGRAYGVGDSLRKKMPNKRKGFVSRADEKMNDGRTKGKGKRYISARHLFVATASEFHIGKRNVLSSCII